MRQVSTKEVSSFIKKGLIARLRNDSRKNRVASEGDLQSAAYFHIRRFLRKDGRWVISNKLTVGKKGDSKIYPDLVISTLRHKLRPRIAIELKEKKAFSTTVIKKDLTKLGTFLSKARLKAGFLIYLCRGKPPEKELNRKAERLKAGKSDRLYPIIINSLEKMPAREYKLWKKRNAQLSRLINR